MFDLQLPAIWVEEDGKIIHWIDVGNVSLKKLEVGLRKSKRVTVYTYRNLLNIKKMLEKSSDKSGFEVFYFDRKFLSELNSLKSQNNQWTLNLDGLDLTVKVAGRELCTTLKKIK